MASCLTHCTQISGYPDLWSIGHGDTSYYGVGSDDLKHAQLNYVSNEDCTTAYDYDDADITTNMMCARDDGEDSCQGDSGENNLIDLCTIMMSAMHRIIILL